MLWFLSGLILGSLGVLAFIRLRDRSFKEDRLTLSLRLEEEKHKAIDGEERFMALKRDFESIRNERDQLSRENAGLETRIVLEKSHMEEKLSLLENAKESMALKFENLANQILEEKTARFTELNQTQISSLLIPLGEKLKEFGDRVQKSSDKESEQRTILKSEIAKLMELNSTITRETSSLTRALKGDSRSQGVWGEMILERTLEMSGLRKDREFRVQASFTGEEGDRLRPDIIIDLPENRHLVIDSKVSLTAYERFLSDPVPEEKKNQALLHVQSVRAHFNELSRKDYRNILSLSSVDFVLMFIPMESAYALAVETDPELIGEALGKNVLIVYPGTLLMALRTIAHVWRYEEQNRNALDIARKAGLLYDKFVGFVNDLEEIGEKLEKAQTAYGKAYGKLVQGKGNLVRSSESLRDLGVKTGKVLSEKLRDASLQGEERAILGEDSAGWSEELSSQMGLDDEREGGGDG
jgi:DNA recombination protein RmuC